MQRKIKIIMAIIAACAMSVGLVAAIGPLFSTYTRTLTWTQATPNTQFELDVNGTQAPAVSAFTYTFTYATDQYCEVYTLTDQGNVPIIITASVTGSGATPTWMSNNVAYLAPGQVTAMAIYFTGFAYGGGSDTVTFSSAQAFPNAVRVTSYTVAETADADSGQFGNGFWAMDSFSQNIQIYNNVAGSGGGYVAFIDYVGTWQTWAGIASPAAATLQGASGSGNMLFSYAATFSSLGSGDTLPTTGTTLTETGGGYTSGGQIYPGASPYHWYSDSTYFPTSLSITEVGGEIALYTYGALVYNNPSVTQAQIWTGFGGTYVTTPVNAYLGHGNIVIPA